MKLSKIIAAACAFSLFLTPSAAFAKTLELTLGNNDVYINNGIIEKQTVEVAPYTENERTLVPIRIISENFGLNVEWDDLTKTVTISNDTLTIKLVIGSSEAYVNDKVVTLDVPAIEKDGRTLVPVRFVSETLGKTVKWISPSEQILISDENTLLKSGDSEYTLDHYIGMMALYGYSVEYTTLILTEMGKIKAEALKNGYVFKNTDMVKEAYQEFCTMKEDVYAITLLAPIIELIETSIMASEYLNSFTEVNLPSEQIEEIYNSSYVCAKHILISTIDMTTGETFSDSKKNTARKIAETVISKLKSGEDFDSLVEKYNEDPGMQDNPQGYVFTTGEMVEEFEQAVYGMKEGETSGIVETSYGYHIIKREKLPELSDALYAYIEDGILYEIGNAEFEECMANNTSTQYVTDAEINTLINNLMN